MANPSVTRPSRPGWVAITSGVIAVVGVGVAGLLLGAAGIDAVSYPPGALEAEVEAAG